MPPLPLKSILPPAWNVPEEFKSRLGDSAGRQRAMFAEGQLLLVLHAPPGPDDDHRDARLFWRDAAGNWKASGITGAGITALRNHLEDFATRLDKLEARFQAADTATEYFELLQAIAPLHRTTRNMHTALQNAREMLPNDREMISLRDRAGELEREAELLHTDSKNGMDYTVARRSEELAGRSYDMAVASHRLNLLAALFFPIATASSIFGMNLNHGLNDRNVEIFLLVLLISFLVGGVLMLLINRRPWK
jgi:Mg2+ and Co2+ transporter CorA